MVVVVVPGEDDPELLLPDETGGTVPCGRSTSVYWVPSAVFTSVTGLFTFSVRAAWPDAYEPPAIETFAVVAVAELSWKIGFAAGKSAPAETDSSVPFTERTTVVGGGEGGGGGVVGVVGVVPPEEPDEPDDPEEPDDDEPEGVEPWASNGSLLEKRENDWSWPGSAGGVTTATSVDESVGAAVVVVVGVPASVGAAAVVGAVVGAGVVTAGPATGFEPPPLFIPIIVLTAYAMASTSTTARTMTIFFCFACFALAASATCFLATTCSFHAD
ncbi:MAG: hypothetical protein ACXVRI_00820 [Gaiellaceae bacterium]